VVALAVALAVSIDEPVQRVLALAVVAVVAMTLIASRPKRGKRVRPA
jgi:hypothetical protein